MKPVTITIDWPSWSGKWTTAKLLAEKLGFKYLDSWSMYRAVWVYLNERKKDLEHLTDADVGGIELSFSHFGAVQINGIDYESRIRTAEAGVYASLISSQKPARNVVIESWKKLLQWENYVLEGRDTGTVWAPNAHVKIYLIADASVRAHRRWLELQKKWDTLTEEEVLKQICERDNRDMTRTDGPLRKPEGAYEIDTTHLEIGEQVERIYEIVQEVLQIWENLS
jgi:CMP/dCMP kinase